MTNAAKWKEFVRWWEEYKEENSEFYFAVYMENAINDKIKELKERMKQ